METDTSYFNSAKQTTDEPDSAAAATQNMLGRGAEAYGKAEKAVCDAYEKTSQKACETYDKAKNYTHDNPGTSILIALGIGVGLGLIIGATSHHESRASRIAKPVVNALSDIAKQYFR